LSYRRLENFYHFIDALSIRRTAAPPDWIQVHPRPDNPEAVHPVPCWVSLPIPYILW